MIVKEAAGGLAGANVSVLNGADGLGEIAAGLVSQGLTILDSVRQGLPSQYQASPPNGRALDGLPGPDAQPAAKSQPEASKSRGGLPEKNSDLLTPGRSRPGPARGGLVSHA